MLSQLRASGNPVALGALGVTGPDVAPAPAREVHGILATDPSKHAANRVSPAIAVSLKNRQTAEERSDQPNRVASSRHRGFFLELKYFADPSAAELH